MVSQSQVPFTFVIEWLKKKCDAKKAEEDSDVVKDQKDADRINNEYDISWFQRQQAQDRLSKLGVMLVYVAINIVLFFWWGSTQAKVHEAGLETGKPESQKMNYVCTYPEESAT